jgi:hypothetical protein
MSRCGHAGLGTDCAPLGLGASALVVPTLFGVRIEGRKSANWKVVVGVVSSSRRPARPLVLREWRVWQ